MISVIIGVGSNCGDRKTLVEEALQWLKGTLMQVKCSGIYETPCATEDGKAYMNAVASGYYDGDAFTLQDLLKDKEREMGRNATCRERGDVPIDLDLVVCDGTVFKPWDFRQKFFRIGYEQVISD